MLKETEYVKDPFHIDDLEGGMPEPWMVEALKLNPNYTIWSPYDHYMNKDGDGWDTRSVYETWNDFGPWQIDELNEIVHFYFEIHKESAESTRCNLGVVLWIIHPRMGSSRAVHIEQIQQEEIKGIVKYLQRADQSNRERFRRLYDYR